MVYGHMVEQIKVFFVLRNYGFNVVSFFTRMGWKGRFYIQDSLVCDFPITVCWDERNSKMEGGGPIYKTHWCVTYHLPIIEFVVIKEII